MLKFIQCRDYKEASIFVLLSSIAALALAYVSEYVFLLKPCPLCIYQRIPYFIAIDLSIIALVLKKYRPIFLKASLFAIAISMSIAIYHVMVEQDILTGPISCSGTSLSGSSDDIIKQLINTEAVNCKTPALVVFGISMAGWNAIYGATIIMYVANRIKSYGK